MPCAVKCRQITQTVVALLLLVFQLLLHNQLPFTMPKQGVLEQRQGRQHLHDAMPPAVVAGLRHATTKAALSRSIYDDESCCCCYSCCRVKRHLLCPLSLTHSPSLSDEGGFCLPKLHTPLCETLECKTQQALCSQQHLDSMMA